MTGHIETPVGLVWVETSARGLVRAELVFYPREEVPGPGAEYFARYREEVARYFSGEPLTFSVPLDASHLPEIRVRLYERVRKIPYGRTTSYGALARELGMSARAVGAALRRSRWFLAVPAHRVIHADGRVGGFAGHEGVKLWLLRFEGAI